jgi:hypothetical protein
MSKEETEQPRLDEYPVRQNDKFKILDARTDYRFINDKGTFGRWRFALLVKTKWEDWQSKETKETIKIIVFRYKYRERMRKEGDSFVGTGNYSWFQEEQMTVTTPKSWRKLHDIVSPLVEQLVE